ncbi:MAG: MarR family transcriptional regulator [Vicinamibacterales bacterium]
MSQAEAHILTHLVGAGPSTVAELHEAFGHRRSTLTSILDRLEARGFATRATSRRDRRTFVVALTDPGRRAARSALKTLRAFERAVEKDVSPDDLRGFLAVVEKVSALGVGRIDERARQRRIAPR